MIAKRNGPTNNGQYSESGTVNNRGTSHLGAYRQSSERPNTQWVLRPDQNKSKMLDPYTGIKGRLKENVGTYTSTRLEENVGTYTSTRLKENVGTYTSTKHRENAHPVRKAAKRGTIYDNNYQSEILSSHSDFNLSHRGTPRSGKFRSAFRPRAASSRKDRVYYGPAENCVTRAGSAKKICQCLSNLKDESLLQKIKSALKRHRETASSDWVPLDYGIYKFKRKELYLNILMYLVLDAVISFLFYRSFLPFLILAPFCVLFLELRRRELGEKQKERMLSEFSTGIQMVNASLQAGYATENAFREAASQLLKIYPEDSFVIQEFRFIISQTLLNIPIETLLLDLGKRSHVEDIMNFAQTFRTAKRTGGDMIGTIRGAVASIQARMQTREEIETNLSGKESEQKVMSAAPLFIMAYTSITSPGFLDICYCTVAGRAIMTICLIIYIAAFLWGRKIMRIET